MGITPEQIIVRQIKKQDEKTSLSILEAYVLDRISKSKD